MKPAKSTIRNPRSPILWAPWRLAYVKRATQEKGCLFCRIARQRQDTRNLVVLRSRLGFSMLNRFPYNNGHILIQPYRHIATLDRLKDEEWLDLLQLLVRTQTALQKVLKPHGYNLGLNFGRVAGAGVLGHLHLHLVPRWNGDTNFMPLLAQTKVIPQSLSELHRLLRNIRC